MAFGWSALPCVPAAGPSEGGRSSRLKYSHVSVWRGPRRPGRFFSLARRTRRPHRLGGLLPQVPQLSPEVLRRGSTRGTPIEYAAPARTPPRPSPYGYCLAPYLLLMGYPYNVWVGCVGLWRAPVLSPIAITLWREVMEIEECPPAHRWVGLPQRSTVNTHFTASGRLRYKG